MIEPTPLSPLVGDLVHGLWWKPERHPVDTSQDDASTKSSVDLRARVEGALETARLSTEGGAFATIAGEEALAAAPPGGRPAGELEELIVGIKDMVAIRGLPRICGSATRADSLPEVRDASMMSELRRHGIVLLGTTAMHELAFGVTGINEFTGTALNPVDKTRIPGGSSSGSAVAVAEGSVDVAIGSDTGGSVRIPSALCGIAGFKPTLGTYPMDGVHPVSPTLDHLGFHARSMRDIVTVYEALSASTVGTRKLTRVGVVPGDIELCDPIVGRAIERATGLMHQSGIEIVPVDLPAFDRVFRTSTAILLTEAYAVNRRLVEERFDLLGQDVAERFSIAIQVPGFTYYSALSERQRLIKDLGDAFAGVDCIVGPTVPIVAPTIEQARLDPTMSPRLVTFARLANVTGCAAATIPIASDDLPVGLQVMCPTNDRALDAARTLETILQA